MTRQRRSVALIMPALNESGSVTRTLDAVFASTRLPDEIIVADAQSGDDTVARVQAYAGRGVRVVCVPNPGVFAGAGRNRAALAARSELLLFLDFGNRLDPHWIEAMAGPMEADPTVEAVGGLFLPDPVDDFERCVAAMQYHLLLAVARMTDAQRRAMVPASIRLGGLGMAVTRQRYLAEGGMPEWLRAAEDNLFGRKLQASGARTVAALDALQHHHMRSSLRDVWRQNLVYARGEGRIATPLIERLRTYGVYGVAALLAVTLAGGWLPALAGVLAYLQTLAGHRLRRSGMRLGPRGRWVHAPLILLAKDLGVMAGYALGRLDRLVQPRWRRLHADYLVAGPLRDPPPGS
jgi:cellulose synthase/poly-beta-1,6-N-acetylglucosamine synthase-like glycosyltransferase